MDRAATLLPLVVLVPLLAAALLLALAHWLHPRVGDVAGVAVAAFVAVLCAWLARESAHEPVLHWFGGWTPAVSGRPGVVLGIAFSADPVNAAVAAFCGLLFFASFLFSWSYFDHVGVHYHVLMLLFLAAMAGFCLTRDLFNLFVWFELMSVSAYALTAYPLGSSALEGAFNFTIVNSLASFLMLGGIGLLYARAGVLDMAALGAVVSRTGADSVTIAGFLMIALALLTKGACVPFHFWLPDAHAVAPSPVSVIFSGAMTSVALFGLARLIATSFAGDDAIMALVHHVLPRIGAATALVGALAAWSQRHLKRMLAFSTVAHLGIMLTAVATGEVRASGLLAYLIGHGAVKACLFMIAGVLLALRAANDEIDLYARARDLWPAGLLLGIAGLLLGGLPLGLLHEGLHGIEHAHGGERALHAILVIATALTGAAVLRAGLRIFAGASGTPGPERDAVTERGDEERDRSLVLMLVPAAGMLAFLFVPLSRLGLAVDPGAGPEAATASIAPLVLALAIVGASLLRRRPTSSGGRLAARIEGAPFRLLGHLHSGHVADYVAWMLLGLAGLSVAASV